MASSVLSPASAPDIRSSLCRLPVFRPVAVKTLRLLGGDDAGVPAIAALLRSDTGLTAEVLAAANSALYGAPRRIDNLDRALLVLGFQRARCLVLTVALRSFTRHQANPAIMFGCWRHSIATAILAEELSFLYGIPRDLAYTAGLIHDVGRLSLLNACGDKYAPVFATALASQADCLAAERELLGMDHCQAGLLVTQRWFFPPELSRVAGCHHDEMSAAKTDLTSLACMACCLADSLGFAAVPVRPPAWGEAIARLPVHSWNSYSYDEDEIRARIDRNISALT